LGGRGDGKGLERFGAFEDKLVDEELIRFLKMSTKICVLLNEQELGLEDGGIGDVNEGGRCGSCRSSLPLAEWEGTDIRKSCEGKTGIVSRLNAVPIFFFFCSFTSSC
jgi:hypothetical protein